MTGRLPAEPLTIRYFDIAWLSHHDGPGQRVVLFLQGCHLHCPWCHSPHSRPPAAPLLFFAARCRRCGRCEAVCPQAVHHVSTGEHRLDRERCRRCGACIDACPVSSRGGTGGALALPTQAVTVAALWDLLYPQLDLLRKIGGITVSGGEALLQSAALQELLCLCRGDGIHTTVETSGSLPTKRLADVAGLVDCWLFGLRPTPLYTEPSADLIAENLAFLRSTAARVIIRTPVIAGVTDLPKSLAQIAATMAACGLTEIQLLPCNRATAHYYHAAGLACPTGPEAVPTAARMDAVRQYFQQRGLAATIVR